MLFSPAVEKCLFLKEKKDVASSAGDLWLKRWKSLERRGGGGLEGRDYEKSFQRNVSP